MQSEMTLSVEMQLDRCRSWLKVHWHWDRSESSSGTTKKKRCDKSWREEREQFIWVLDRETFFKIEIRLSVEIGKVYVRDGRRVEFVNLSINDNVLSLFYCDELIFKTWSISHLSHTNHHIFQQDSVVTGPLAKHSKTEQVCVEIIIFVNFRRQIQIWIYLNYSGNDDAHAEDEDEQVHGILR